MLTRNPTAYPTRAAFRQFTDARVGTLATTIRAYYSHLLAIELRAERYHALPRYVEEDLSAAEDCFSTYLNVRLPAVDQTAMRLNNWHSFQLFSRLESSLNKMAFRESASGSRLLIRLSPLIEQAEARLTHIPSTEATFTSAHRAEVEDYLSWTLAVRICLLITLLRAFDYYHFWQNVDGDAGWLMSSRILELAAWLKAQSAWGELTASLDSVELGWYDLTLFSTLREHLQSLGDLQVKIAKWRSLTKSGTGNVAQLGVDLPSEFKPAPTDLVGRASTAPQFYGRVQLWHRIALVRRFWQYVRSQLQLPSDSPRYRFTLIGGSLQHGGKHQPHTQHRNGSEVDLDLTCLPDLIDQTKQQVRVDLLTGDFEIVDGFDEPAGEFEQFFPIDSDWVFPAANEPWQLMKKRFAGCGFTNTPDPAQVQVWNRIAQHFTQCIYLTFPSSIIFASHNISVTARDRLMERVSSLMLHEEQKDAPNQQRTMVLRVVTDLLKTIRPVVWLDKDKTTAEKIRYTHRHHWHVNYNANRLGDEPGFSGDRQLAKIIDQTLEALEQLGLWRELLV